jgi:hypothetical protein
LDGALQDVAEASLSLHIVELRCVEEVCPK